jgi:hypothetical protein
VIERYSHAKHYELVERWLAGYGLPVPPRSFFSETGLVSGGICVGFLYLTNSRKAWIDQIVADKTSPRSDRSKALDELIEGLKRMAADEKVETLQVMTSGPLVDRFARLGFETVGHYTFLIR